MGGTDRGGGTVSAFGGGSFNGAAFGPGTRLHVTSVEGLDDLPGIRGDDEARAGAHGTYSGPDYAEGRTVVLGLGLRGDSPEGLGTLVSEVRQAFTVTDTPLTLTLRDGAERVVGKVRRRSVPYDASRLARIGDALVEFYCADPRVYGPEVVGATGMANLVGGLGFDTGFPLSFGGVGSSGGEVEAPNGGNVNGSLSIVITAGANPLVTPTIQPIGSGMGSFTVNATFTNGEVITIRPADRLLLIDGTPRRDLVATGSVWPSLPPGGVTLRFSSPAYTDDATMTVTSSPARL